MRLIPLLIIGSIVLFVTGLVAPRRSERLQHWINHWAGTARVNADRRAGWLGDWTAKCLGWGQDVVRAASRAGRSVRGRLTGNA